MVSYGGEIYCTDKRSAMRLLFAIPQ